MTPFTTISAYDFRNDRDKQIITKINSFGKNYILNIDESDFLKYLFELFYYEPVVIYFNSEVIAPPDILKENIKENNASEYHLVDVYYFNISYNYRGSEAVFYIHPDTFILNSYDITIDQYKKTVSFGFKLYNQNKEEFLKLKQQCFDAAFCNLSNANKVVEATNSNLEESIKRVYSRIKDGIIKENEFLSAIKVQVNPETQSIFSTPTITKKIIPQPTLSENKEFSLEPTIAFNIYQDILRLLYESGKSMEKKPSLYKEKNEEGIRDQFLYLLETRYLGITASGETFNSKGKTDILLRYSQDGTNLFVAECKFWHGSAEFKAAITQLISLYLTWRDSKTALLIFVTNKDFSNVLKNIENDVRTHQQFKRANGVHGESSFSYIFTLPQDSNKEIYLEVIAFHFYQ